MTKMRAITQDALYRGYKGDLDFSNFTIFIPNKNDKKYFERSSKAYSFTNESLEMIVESVEHKGKKILSIVGAGDYMITALANDCAECTGIDISLVACLFAELKMAAVKELNYDGFRYFLGIPANMKQPSFDRMPAAQKKNKAADPYSPLKSELKLRPQKFDGSIGEAFSKHTYQQLRHQLSHSAQLFFDSTIGYHYIDEEGEERPYALHYISERLTPDEMGYIPYLKDRQSYEAAQKKIKARENPLMFPADLLRAPNLFSGPFDIIYISNVPQYNTSLTGGNSIMQRIRPLLSEGGLIITYNYSAPEDQFPQKKELKATSKGNLALFIKASLFFNS